ncbi:MAG: hypothetical protein IPG58_08175 [Acidobacteria bacterium]|nr:hypothetical protein [Acidobacteriota bacterium]
MTNGPAKVTGKVDGAGAAGWLVNHNAESANAQLRYRLKDVKFAAEAAFKVGDKNFNAGSYIIKAEGNPADTAARVAKEAAEPWTDRDGS